MKKNYKGYLPGANFNRPSGCNLLAESLDPLTLMQASMLCNRATRRKAIFNMAKQARKWTKTNEGRRYVTAMNEDER